MRSPNEWPAYCYHLFQASSRSFFSHSVPPNHCVVSTLISFFFFISIGRSRLWKCGSCVRIVWSEEHHVQVSYVHCGWSRVAGNSTGTHIGIHTMVFWAKERTPRWVLNTTSSTANFQTKGEAFSFQPKHLSKQPRASICNRLSTNSCEGIVTSA